MNYKKFLGAASAALMIAIAILLLATSAFAASKYKTLHKFKGKDGRTLDAGLIFDQAGNLYGTTHWGGNHKHGTVFKLTPNGDGSWTESVLHSFKTDGQDGMDPEAGLIFDSSGNLYGTTPGGGAYGYNGTVFELTPNGDGSWTESVLHSFSGVDGEYPVAGLTLDSAGNLYGTTYIGGAYGYGTVFRLTPNGDGNWTESMLHSFNYDSKDGAYCMASLIFDGAGNLYGTTLQGGAYGSGTAFKLTPNADGTWTERILYSFCSLMSCSDGANPQASLIADKAGDLYGTTIGGSGTVFKLTLNPHGNWSESVLHSFAGDSPEGGLVFDSAGNLYGTTSFGGGGYGTIFILKRTIGAGWKTRMLHSFRNHPGASPRASLIFDAAGNLYGTTSGDDYMTFGSVFEITP